MPKKSEPDLKIALVGARGRMGAEIKRLASGDRVRVAHEVNSSAADWKKVRKADVVVDFSTPDGLMRALSWCADNKVPLVSGTTGLTEKNWTALNHAGKTIPILHSGNMSLGIAVMSAMLKTLSAVPDWDFQIEEVHHNRKKDKPSGTALLLQKSLQKAVRKHSPKPLGIRGGGVPGIHTLWAMGPEEVLVLQHTAFNRQVFARGALRAAWWLFDKNRPGLYDLTDLYKVD